MEPEAVLAVHDVPSTYHVPMLLHNQHLISTLRAALTLDSISQSKALVQKGAAIWTEWKSLAPEKERLFDEVEIVLVGKYTNLHDSYLSVIKSLEHAAMHCRKKLKLLWVDASKLEAEAEVETPGEYHRSWAIVSRVLQCLLSAFQPDVIATPGRSIGVC